MNISLIIVVCNEEASISMCLESVLPFCREAIVVDTGSKDKTVELIEKSFGIRVHKFVLPSSDPYNIVPARNYALSLAQHPWILILDADEVVDCTSKDFFDEIEEDPNTDGYFSTWQNSRQGIIFNDYKLFLFRNKKHIKFLGCVHSVPQTSFRLLGLRAKWLPGLTIHHKRVENRVHRQAYASQLRLGIKNNPDWIRYHWFLGYSLYQVENFVEAEFYLRQAVESESKIFPVEALNASLVLSELLIAQERLYECEKLIDFSLEFLESVKDDFEIKINIHLQSWLRDTLLSLKSGNKEQVKAPLFAY